MNVHDVLAVAGGSSTASTTSETIEYPLPVDESWGDKVRVANNLCSVIDAHLAHERKIQGESLRPIGLCDKQKVSLGSDLVHVLGVN